MMLAKRCIARLAPWPLRTPQKFIWQIFRDASQILRCFSSAFYFSSGRCTSVLCNERHRILPDSLVAPFRIPTTTCRPLQQPQPNILWFDAHFFLTTSRRGTILRLQTRDERKLHRRSQRRRSLRDTGPGPSKIKHEAPSLKTAPRMLGGLSDAFCSFRFCGTLGGRARRGRV